MRDSSRWAERVVAWQASGLSAAAFSAEHGISVHSLRKWRQRQLDASRRGSRTKALVRLARVEVVPSRAEPAGSRSRTDGSGVRIEFGGARVVVDREFDRATLAAVIEVFAARRGARS